MKTPFPIEDVPYPDLAEALWNWLRVACPTIAAAGGHGLECDDFIVAVGDDRFERVCRERTVYRQEAVLAAMRIPEFSNILPALQNESDIAPHVNRWIGGGFDLFPLRPDRLAQLVLPRDDTYSIVRDLAQPNADFVAQPLHALQAFVNGQAFDVEYITPVWNLDIDQAFTLEEGLTIELMGDDVATVAMNVRAILGDLIRYRRYDRGAGRNVCVRRRLSLPKLSLDRAPEPDDIAKLGPDTNGYRDVEKLLDVLPSVAEGSVRHGATIRKSCLGSPWGIVSKVLASAAAPALDDSPLPARMLRIDHEATLKLTHFWDRLRDDPARGSVAVAMRRLRYASERRIDEDRIVDLMIAAEALFIERGSDHNELRLRTSLNAAFYLEPAGKGRDMLMRLVRGAYDVRSAIVHGDDPAMVRIAGVDLTLHDLVTRLNSIVRDAVQRRLSGDPGDIDWLELVVGR